MRINDLYVVVDDSLGFQGMHRVLWIAPARDVAVTIAVPILVPKLSNQYFRGPTKRSLIGLQAAVSAGSLRPTELNIPGLLLMTDEEILKRYPPTKTSKATPIKTRDRYVRALEPVLAALKQDRRTFFEHGGMTAELRRVSKSGPLNPNQLYQAMHRFLAIAIGTNAFLPLRSACGGPGKERRQSSSLGNTTKAFKAGLSNSTSFVLTDDDKRKLALGWCAFLDGKNSKEDAYDLTMAVHYADGTHIKDGVEVPCLLPIDQRPTLAQFSRWGPKGDDGRQAWETLLGVNEKEMSYRALEGSSLDGVSAVGQLAFCDATPADHHLVTGSSRLKPIGSATQLLVQDAFTSIISGICLGLEAPSGAIALLSVLHGAMDSVDLCRRYGVEIEPDDMPAIFFGTYLVDNGEFRSKHVIQSLTALGSAIELTATYRGDLKGLVEAAHRSTHKLLDHKVEGTTRGRQRKRGESKPALTACWRFPEAMRLRLQAIRYFNTQMRVEKFYNQHPLASKMKRDGVPPIRKAIYQWCVQNGYVESPSFHEDKLRAALLTEMRAIVRENGVFLLRPDVGRRVEIIYPHRFLGPRVKELRWLERARRSGTFSVNVRVDPNDMTRIWLVDDMGIHELLNTALDIDFVQSATLVDSLAVQDEDAESRELARQETDQARTDYVVARTVADDHYQRDKQKEIRARKKKPTKVSLAKDVRKNRQEELIRMASGTDGNPEEKDRVETASPAELNEPDWADQVLADHRGES